MTRVVGFLLFGVAIGCSSKPTEPKVDPKAADGFARTLEAVAGADPTQSAALLAQGAFESIAPSEKCLESFAAGSTEKARVEALLDCGLACTLDAVQKLKGKEPRTWMAALAAACDPAHFGLEKSEAAILSPEWFLVHKLGELAGPHVTAAKGAVKAKIDQAMASFRLPLPLPAVATGLYELPVAPEAASVPVATRTYVIVPAKGELRVGASPYAVLGARGAALTAPEGRALFPGNEVAPADLRAILLDSAGAPAAHPPDAGPPPGPLDAAPPLPADAAPAKGQYKMKGNADQELAKRQAIENARAAGILGALGKMDADHSALGSGFGAIGAPPGLHGEVSQTLRGDLGRDGDPVALLCADSARPAAEVIDIATSLPRLLIAVASPDDTAARALAIEIHSALDTTGRAPGQAWVELAAGKLEEASKAAGGSEETVVIRAADGVPWKDAVAVAAVAVARGAKRVIFTTSGLDWTGGGGGLLGHGAYGQGKPALSLITEGTPTATGDLDKDVIRRVIRSRMGLVRACYERELVRDAKLAGRVDLEFTIGADGAVSKAKATGLPKVSDCVVRQVQALKFPPPKGGGVVNVRYPFTFKAKDESP